MPLFRAGRPFILIFIRDVRKYQGKNKTQGNGLKIDFNDGMTCLAKIFGQQCRFPLETGGVSPPAEACLAAVAWHYCYNVTLYVCPSAACGLRLVTRRRRWPNMRGASNYNIAELHDARTLKNGQLVPALLEQLYSILGRIYPIGIWSL